MADQSGHSTGRGRSAVKIGAIAAIVIGMLIGVVSFVSLIGGVIEAIGAPAFAIPGSTSRHLKAGTYVVFERTGTQSGSSNVRFTNDRGVSIGVEQVTVTAADGTRIPVRDLGHGETITRNRAIFTGAVTFTNDVERDVTVTVRTERSGQAIVSSSLTGTARKALGKVGGLLLGGLLAFVGIVVLIVGAVRRNRGAKNTGPAPLVGSWVPPQPSSAPSSASSPAPSPVEPSSAVPPSAGAPGAGATPAGWYPTGQAPGELGWWDGARWTEHRHRPDEPTP